MAILGPITTDAKLRDFAVIDLEWTPALRMPLPVHTALQFDVVSSVVRVPLPVAEKKSKPLGVRMAAFYDERPVDDIDNGDSNTKTRIPRFEWFRTTRELIDFMLVRENRSRWFYAHAGGLADMEFVLDELLNEVKGHLLTSNNLYGHCCNN